MSPSSSSHSPPPPPPPPLPPLLPPAAHEVDHPLRSDPLNELPDAVRVPRVRRRASPRPRVSSSSSPPPPFSPLPSRARPPAVASIAAAPPSPDQLSEQVSSLLHDHRQRDAHDPLLHHLAQRVVAPPPPPAGHAYAADMHQVLAACDASERASHSDGVMDRSDLTLFAAPAHRGLAAGVFVVRSRRNWAIVSTPTPDDYYLVRRSIADFLWLHDSLRARNEGVIVPLLPPLSVAGRVKHGFAYEHERLRGLQTFLRRVATHAVLSTSDELLAFLGALGDDEWLKIRREAVSHESSITSALFGSSADENAWHRLSHWGEKLLWQTARRVNNALVWFLERDAPDAAVHDSAEARVERLHTYVKELGVSLASVRHAAEKVHKQRDAERSCALSMQNALRELGTREGGKLGLNLAHVTLQIPAEGDRHSPQLCHPGGGADDGSAIVVAANRVLGAQVHGATVSAFDSPPSREKLRRSPSDSDVRSRRVAFASPQRSRSMGDRAGEAHHGALDHPHNGVTIALPVARVVDDVFRDYEERAKGAQRIMNARREEQDAYEHAVAVYTKLRDQLESRTGSMWDGRTVASNESLEGLKTDVHRASNRLKEIRERYKKVALSTTDELRRLRNDMHEDLCEALHGMAVEYARQHAAHAEAWKSLSHCVNEFRRSSKTDATSSPPSGSTSRSTFRN